MPRRSDGAIRRIFMHQRGAVFGEDVTAEEEELASDTAEAGGIQGMRDQGAIARPHVGVVRAVAAHDVGIIGGEDGPTPVGLCPNDQQ